MSNRDDWPFYPPSKPRQVTGGMRAKSVRGKIAATWWSSRFIEVLESMGMGGRLTRGRNYARRGQVLSVALDAGVVTAQVQGSRARPYRVRIGVGTFGKADWAQVEERMSSDAWFVAQLLSGQMPPDIEALFEDAGLSLFPTHDELSLDCSCPDWGVPCKHIAAVFYLLAEKFDEDPFQILAWRGRDRDDLLSRLHAASGPSADDIERLADLLDRFWTAPTPDPASEIVRARAAAADGYGVAATSLADQLPAVPVTVRGKSLPVMLAPAYAALAVGEEGHPLIAATADAPSIRASGSSTLEG